MDHAIGKVGGDGGRQMANSSQENSVRRRATRTRGARASSCASSPNRERDAALQRTSTTAGRAFCDDSRFVVGGCTSCSVATTTRYGIHHRRAITTTTTTKRSAVFPTGIRACPIWRVQLPSPHDWSLSPPDRDSLTLRDVVSSRHDAPSPTSHDCRMAVLPHTRTPTGAFP